MSEHTSYWPSWGLSGEYEPIKPDIFKDFTPPEGVVILMILPWAMTSRSMETVKMLVMNSMHTSSVCFFLHGLGTSARVESKLKIAALSEN